MAIGKELVDKYQINYFTAVDMFRFQFRSQYMYQVTVAYYTSYTLTEYKEKTD